MELSQGEAVTILKRKSSSTESKLKALNIIFNDEKLRTFNRLSKLEMWELCKFMYKELLAGYGDVKIAEKNPCYRCYLGAVNRCAECDLHYQEWTRHLDSPYYEKQIKFKDIPIELLEEGESNAEK